MAEFDYGYDGLKHLKFMTDAARVAITVDLQPDEGWADAMDRIREWADGVLTDGTYRIMLGNESKLTDDSAEFAVYCLPEETPLVRRRWLGESF